MTAHVFYRVSHGDNFEPILDEYDCAEVRLTSLCEYVNDVGLEVYATKRDAYEQARKDSEVVAARAEERARKSRERIAALNKLIESEPAEKVCPLCGHVEPLSPPAG